MMMPRRSTFIAFLLGIVLSACNTLIGPYSPVAYQNATSLKAETLALMDKAAEPYSSHQAQVEKIFVEADKAYEYVSGIPSNSISAEQWRILKSRNGDLLGAFFGRWQTEGTLSKGYIAEFKPIVSDAFDQIICLEANKKANTVCKKEGSSQ